METSKKSNRDSRRSSKSARANSNSRSDENPSKASRRSAKKELEKAKVIRLLGNRSVYHVSVDDFVKVSLMIRQQQNAGNLMTSVDLHRFSDQSILAFVNYVQNREIKSNLTYYAITELVTLARTFLMKDLKDCLEDCIITASKTSEGDLLQTLIICDVTHISPETERTLQSSAIESIERLGSLPDFHKIPHQQLFQILSSCELNISHEMFIADIVLLWLSGQTRVNSYAPAMFSCIRAKFLSAVDKTLILERINMLNLPDKLVRLARNTLESTNSQRVCLDPSHLKKNLPRCGQNSNFSQQNFGTYSSLPLSRPNFTIKMKKGKGKEGKVKEKFDPAANPTVIDLISNDNMTSAKSKNNQTCSSSRKKKKVVKKRNKKCACVEYLKKKFGSNGKEVKPASKDPSTVRVKHPGASTMSTKTPSVSSKFSSTNRSSGKGKNNERRAKKREKIDKAMTKLKSETSSKNSGSSKSSKKIKKL